MDTHNIPADCPAVTDAEVARKPRRLRDKAPSPDYKCAAPGCEKNRDSKGFCPQHYHMWKKYGDPLAKGARKPGAGLKWLEEHKTYDKDECLIWPFGSCGNTQFPGSKGYGQSYYQGKKIGAHVLMAIWVHGDRRSEGLIVAHTCGKGHEGCCSPRHVKWSTYQENTADRYLHGTVPLGSSHPLSKLTEQDVVEIRAMYASCTRKAIAEKFNIDQSTVESIHRRETWRHVP